MAARRHHPRKHRNRADHRTAKGLQPASASKVRPTPGKLESFIHGPCEDGKFLCLYPGCGKKFGRRYNLCSHIQTHLADRPYSCSSCEASFVRQHDLKRHERTHAVVKPHICPCGRASIDQTPSTDTEPDRSALEASRYLANPSHRQAKGPTPKGRTTDPDGTL